MKYLYKTGLKSVLIQFVLLSLLTLTTNLIAQKITIIDQKTKKPLKLATVESPRFLEILVTDDDGNVVIPALDEDEFITIKHIGYKRKNIDLSTLKKLKYVVYVDPDITFIDGIVISASRWEQRSAHVPAKISQISSTDIKFLNPQTAADMLGKTGEVFIQKSQQGGGSPMIRGFATNRLLYVVDGVRMNSAIFRSGNIQNVISLDPLAIENTEVLFGPGSVMYGSDAIGGVMVFQTRKPEFSLGKKFSSGGGTTSRYASINNEYTQNINFNLKWKNFSSISTATYSSFGDLKMGKYGRDEYLKPSIVERVGNRDLVLPNPNPMIQNPSGYTQINLMQKLRYQPAKNWDIQYGFHYSETSDYSRYDRLIEVDAAKIPIFAVWNYGPQKWMLNNFSVSNFNKTKLFDAVTLRLGHQIFEESRIDRRVNRPRLRTQKESVNAYSGNLDITKSKGKHHIYYGLEFVENKVNSEATSVDITNNNVFLVPNRYPESEWRSLAAYTNYQYLMSDQITFQTGIRWNRYSLLSDFTKHLSFYPFDFTNTSLSDMSVNGSLGMIYKPDVNTKFFVNLSTGYRAPNVDDIGKLFDFGPNEVIVPNIALKAENAYNIEIGINKVIGSMIKIDATIFYTYLDNAMVRRDFKVNGRDSILFNGVNSKVFAIQNAAYANIYGAHLGVNVNLPNNFEFSSRFNYQKGVEEMDNRTISRSRHVAPVFGINQLSYHHRKITLQLNHTYNGEISYNNLNFEERLKTAIYAKDEDGKPFSPAWYTINFNMMYNLSKNITISGALENISDQRYRPYSSGLVAGGRNFVLALNSKM